MTTPNDNRDRIHNGKLRVKCSPHEGKDEVTLTADWDGEVIAVEEINLAKPRQRAELVNRMCNGRTYINKQALESQLMTCANALLRSREYNNTAATANDCVEIDVSHIVRPERFISHAVSGVAVPGLTTTRDTVKGQWTLYLRWADGKRERRPMSKTVNIPEGSSLFVYPDPSEPTPTTRPGWTADARRRWLDGESAPAPSELFKALATRFAEFVDLPEAHSLGISSTAILWSMLSYIYPAWSAVPYLYIGGPLGSGKSRVFEVLSRLVFRPLSSSNMTAPSLFRTLHSQGGCLLLDEAERLKNTHDPATSEILSMLLAGYKRGGQATRLEPIGDKGFKTVFFDVYGPKALACIAGLPPALASRCIPITMFRAAPGSDKPKRRIDANPEKWAVLRDGLHALALEHGPTWLELPERSDVCPTMSGRDYELWQPLLSLAGWIEEHGAKGLLGKMQEHALATIEEGKDDSTPDADEILLRILTDEIRDGNAPTPGNILEKARSVDDVGFKTWRARGVSEHLKRYGAVTHKSCGRRIYNRVTLDDLQAVQDRYGLDLGL